MDAKKIMELSSKEIQLKIKEFRDELLNLRLKKTTGQMGKPHLIKLKRRTIAQLETALNKKIKQEIVQSA